MTDERSTVELYHRRAVVQRELDELALEYAQLDYEIKRREEQFDIATKQGAVA